MSRGKGIILFSGGLDSLLAAKILIEQDIELIGFHCVLPFVEPDFDLKESTASKLAVQINLPLVYYRCAKEYLDLVNNPPHGYGKHINPCIDCKIYFIKKAAELMSKEGADFISTGEVVGQRPMSQEKHMLYHIEKEAGIKGKLLRPLSAGLMKPTFAEEAGIIDRELLFDINGRSRKMQIKLAEEFGISEYVSPAGGCLFTDKFIARRVKDLFDHHEDYGTIDVYLLTIGRNFRINKRLKIIVSRNEHENNKLEKYINLSDYFFIPDFKGPLVLAKGRLTQKDINLVTSIISRYGKPESKKEEITVFAKGIITQKVQVDDPVSDEVLQKMRI